MIFRLIRYSLSLIGFLALLLVVGSAAAFALVFAGDASLDGCRLAPDGDVVTVERSDALADAFQTKLDAFVATVDTGAPATVSFSSGEATARANSYFENESATVRDVVVCFEPDGAHVSATFADILGRDLTVQVAGDLDLAGEHPRLSFTTLRAGKLPLVGPARGVVARRIDDLLTEIELDHRYTLSFDYGVVVVTAAPGPR